MKKELLILLALFIIIVIIILLVENKTTRLMKENYKEVDTINIKSNIAGINILKSNNNEVRLYVYGNKKDELEVKQESSSLNIDKKYYPSFCLINCTNTITLFIPDNFNEINIDSEYGNIKIDPKIKNLSIKAISSKIAIKNVSRVNLSLTIGNIKIEKLDSISNSSINTERANIKVNKIINTKVEVIKYNKKETYYDKKEYLLKIKTNYGRVEVED